MKGTLFLLVFLLSGEFANCQNYDSLFNKEIGQQLRMKKAIANLSNYEKIIGQKLGNFSAKNISGETITNKKILGKITFINFWFNSCSPCHKEFPEINKLFTKYETDSNFQIITFTFDYTKDVKMAIENNKLLYDVYMMSNESCHKLMFEKGFPCNYLVNEKGEIIYGSGGFDSNGEVNLLDNFIPKIDTALIEIKNNLSFKKKIIQE